MYSDKYEEIDNNMTDCNVGGRKNRSIRDNLFVLNAVINDAIGYQKVEIDIQFYDLTQAFDSMWYEETMNDMWESMTVRDDKFALISEMNRVVDLFVKTPVGDTEIFTMNKIEQQGTGLGPIKCSNQMDSISRECIRDNVGMYMYRNVVTIPPLGMIDDLAAIAKCGPDSIILNAVINAKINMKRLEFNATKCVKLHICKESRNLCPKTERGLEIRNVKCVFLEAQDSEMKSVSDEKYVGDVISSTGSNDANISRRIGVGMAAISQIFGVMHEISLGQNFIEIGLAMREAVLLSKMLLSSESWHKVFQYQVEKLEEVDRAFFRKLLNSHSKTGVEFFYSETASLSIKLKISMRRLLYWWNIIHVDKSEMIYRVYRAQKLSPVCGDWVTLLERDKAQFGVSLSDEDIQKISQFKFKNFIKKKAQELMVENLKKMQSKNSKSKQLEVEDFSISQYLLDARFSKEEREILFKLRSKTIQNKR